MNGLPYKSKNIENKKSSEIKTTTCWFQRQELKKRQF
jgi:hypothetical protein